MPSGYIEHTGFISYCTYDNLIDYYTTVEDNEIIEFKEQNGYGYTIRSCNSLSIEAIDTNLKIRILPSPFILPVEAGTINSPNLQRIKAIQVMGAAGQKLRWYGQY